MLATCARVDDDVCNMRILLAMSGGIDSSVCAHLLREQGHDVIGVRFTLWTDPLAPALAQVLPSKCCTTQNIQRAHSVAEKLSIPLKVVDLTDVFKETVVDPYLAAYREGLTPNPCIGCNRSIKFGRLLDLMHEEHCEMLATGHYARIERRGHDVLLRESLDASKDQSYYLYSLGPDVLKHVMFPLGEMKKTDVYQRAKAYDIPLPTGYKESQDLCFFPEKHPKPFLMRHLKESLRPGPIQHVDGSILGEHDGLPLYTLGQRRGLKIGGRKIPLEVVRKDHEHDALIVADQGAMKEHSVKLTDIQWCGSNTQIRGSIRIQYRTRSLGRKQWGTLHLEEKAPSFLAFDTPQSPQAPGQSVVWYHDDIVVGGGVIQK